MVYFDNAATTYPKPESVYKFMDSFYRENGVNIGRGQYEKAGIARKMREETRELLLELFHCPAKKVVFTHSATEAMNIILQGIEIKDKTTIYISPFEHNAVTRVLNYIKTIYDVKIEQLAVSNITYEYDLERIKLQFADKKPNVVIINHASNVCGVIAPVKEICTLSKKCKAINIIDMAQTAGLIDTDLSSDIYDFSVFAGHKALYGPFGIGGFICDGSIVPKPLMYGGTGYDSGNQELNINIPDMYEVGSPNIIAIAGLNAALKWIKNISVIEIYNKEKENHDILLDIFSEYKNIKNICRKKAAESIGVVSCEFEGFKSDNIGQILSEKDIAIRAGLHCAPIAHMFLRTYPAGTVRFSVSYFNEMKDFDILRNVLKYIYENS